MSRQLQTYIFLGVVLGLVSFWNGTVTISGMLIVGLLAIFYRRYQLLITPVIALIITQVLSWWIVGTDSPVSPRIVYGFLADQVSVLGIFRYYFLTFGFLFALLIPAIVYTKSRYRWWLLAALAPLFFANIIQLAPGHAINHKFINITVILANIFVAGMLARWFNGNLGTKATAAVCLVMLTISGGIDATVLWNRNQNKRVYELDHPVTLWVQQYTDPSAIFLTESALYDPVLWAGRQAFLGNHRYSQAAGYNVKERRSQIENFFQSPTSQQALAFLHHHHIDYVAVASDSPATDFLQQHLQPVFVDDRSQITVYQVPSLDADPVPIPTIQPTISRLRTRSAFGLQTH